MAAVGNESALATQVGGDHYKSMPIQPVEFALLNRLNTAQANIIKYVCRYPKKGGARDLEKAHHYCDIWLQVNAAHGVDWSIFPPVMIDVDMFIEANSLPAMVAKIVELTCIGPSAQRVEEVKALILQLLADFDG